MSLCPMKQDRKEIANTVLQDPSSYKVCAVCGAIVDREVGTCPDCYAYRFICDPAVVSDKAIDLAALPRTAIGHLDLED